IAALIKATSSGPVFYADPRVGLGEREFRMLKFRTMVADAALEQERLEGANEATGALFKIRNDPRVTSVGRTLRRFSLDEVPNVLNVLRGEQWLRPGTDRQADLLARSRASRASGRTSHVRGTVPWTWPQGTAAANAPTTSSFVCELRVSRAAADKGAWPLWRTARNRSGGR